MSEADRKYLRNLAFWCTFILMCAVCGVDLWQQHEQDVSITERRAHVDQIQKDSIERGQRIEARLQEIIERLPPR